MDHQVIPIESALTVKPGKTVRITRECLFCLAPFETTAALIGIGKGKFCSRPCAYGDQFKDSGTPAALAARFTTHVNINGPIPAHLPELGPCHVWIGATDDHGYGVVGFRGRGEKAHRVAFFLSEGRWPSPCGLHRCDNPPCVRRSHLFEGTKKDNSQDMAAKNRHGSAVHPERVPRGDRHGSVTKPESRATGDRSGSRKHPERRPRGDQHYSRTSPGLLARGVSNGCAKLTEDAVREIRASSERLSVLAARFSVTEAAVSMAKLRKTWNHI